MKNKFEGLNMLMHATSRRDFLKICSLIGLGSMIGIDELQAYSSKAKGKVVIVGGGAAGLSVAARLTRWLENPDITLIDPSDKQFYQPGFTMIGGGIYQPDEVYRSQASCIPDGVKWIKDETIAIDPVLNKITTKNNGNISYDFLVLTPGLQMNFDQIEGISRDRLGEGNAHCIYDYTGAQKTWKAIQDFSKTGGRGIYTNTYTKLKCGGAPKKILLLTEHYCRKQNTRSNVNFCYYNASTDLYDVPYFAKRLIEIFNERNIEVQPTHHLKGIDTANKIAYFDKIEKVEREVKNEETGETQLVKETLRTPVSTHYDFMHFTPPMSAPDFVRDSGLGYPEEEKAGSWVMVDNETTVHKKYNNIISLGDCAGFPTSKTSAAVRMQVPVATKNLIALMEGKAPEEKYDGYTACPIITQYGRVLLCEFDYKKTPQSTIPLVDNSQEQWAAWILKKYILKPMYFYGMLNGYM